jgi:transcriptional regulator with XRE-family HTH domain
MIAGGDIGGIIRLARQDRSWRQADLGRAAGYSASTISRLENSRRAGVDVAKLRTVAALLTIPPEVIGALVSVPTPGSATVSGTTGILAQEDPVHRRTFMATGLAIPAGLLSALDDTLALTPAPARRPPPPSPRGWPARSGSTTPATIRA